MPRPRSETSRTKPTKETRKACRPPALKTDIILPIYPTNVNNIITRRKNHEFRKNLFQVQVCRFWIYQTSPVCAITHVATVSRGKKPGEVCDPNGLKNDNFDNGELKSRFAYEILKLEQLKVCLPLDKLRLEGWLKSPQGYCYVQASMMVAVGGSEHRVMMYDNTGSSPTETSTVP